MIIMQHKEGPMLRNYLSICLEGLRRILNPLTGHTIARQSTEPWRPGLKQEMLPTTTPRLV
jgi:hypothetical protein